MKSKLKTETVKCTLICGYCSLSPFQDEKREFILFRKQSLDPFECTDNLSKHKVVLFYVFYKALYSHIIYI